MQAKLALIPFDIPDAETEIMSGPFIEYSGAALAVYKLTKAMMLVALPVFLVMIFLGGIRPSPVSALARDALKYVLLLVAVILIRNTNPRVRIDQAVKFFWGPVTAISVLAVILAFLRM
jgi:NADH-quinone oxidoreductase subunit H